MKTIVTRIGFSLIILIGLSNVSFSQPGKNKDDKKENKGKGNDKDDKGVKVKVKGNAGVGFDDDQGKNGNKGNKNGDKGNNGKRNNGISISDRVDHINIGKNRYDIIVWDRQSFRDRKKYRNQEKVTICHKFNRDGDPGVTLRVSANALQAHLNHGDVRGTCPNVDKRRYSDIYIDKRTNYYTNLQRAQEEVLYSRSLLNYAKERLAQSRLQLADVRMRNMAQADIDRRQNTVVELEQNVSVLESLIGVATTLVVNKLL